MKTKLLKLACGLALLVLATTAPAQSTFNYTITDAGGGNSLVTWSVTGNVTTSPGVAWQMGSVQVFMGFGISAPDIFNDSYAGTGNLLPIPTPDGSYFSNTELNRSFGLGLYFTHNASDSGYDYFSLLTAPATTASGQHLIYHAGTQSAIIPIAFSDFNAGTYQSVNSTFDTPVTVTLTVSPVPEPSTLALFAVGGLGLLLFRRRK